MPDRFSLSMLPAREGDCLHIAYGQAGSLKHILVDAGRQWTWKHALKAYLSENAITELELLVVTHVDRDHIDGMMAMLGDPDFDLEVKNIWFNTWAHLRGEAIVLPVHDDPDTEAFGAKMGEQLSTLIIGKNWPWNSQFSGKAVEISDDPEASTICFDELCIRLLSPDRSKLTGLIPGWKKECEKAGLTPGGSVKDYVPDDDEIEEFGSVDIDALAAEPFREDHSKANGSSIAFLLEYKGIRFLLSADAHADLLVKSLEILGASTAKPLHVHAFKLPHHGSKYNISSELLGLIQCENYLVSSNGNYFKHPEDVAMARLIKHGTRGSVINFNYKTDYNDFWKNDRWESQYHYSTNYPVNDKDGFLTLSFEVPD